MVLASIFGSEKVLRSTTARVDDLLTVSGPGIVVVLEREVIATSSGISQWSKKADVYSRWRGNSDSRWSGNSESFNSLLYSFTFNKDTIK